MYLRHRTLKKINKLGRKDFMNQLKKLSTTLTGEQQDKIHDIIIYIDILFETELNMEREAIDIKSMYYDGIRVLSNIKSNHDEVAIDILLEIHHYNLNYIKSLRNIA